MSGRSRGWENCISEPQSRDGKECQKGGSLCLLEEKERELSFAKRTGRSRPALSCVWVSDTLLDGWFLMVAE